jgi:hypothetical protein
MYAFHITTSLFNVLSVEHLSLQAFCFNEILMRDALREKINCVRVEKKLLPYAMNYLPSSSAATPSSHIGIVALAGRQGPRAASILAVAFKTRFDKGLVPHLRPRTKA